MPKIKEVSWKVQCTEQPYDSCLIVTYKRMFWVALIMPQAL